MAEHYDTTENTTGVIDNGTEVSVILEVAQQLKNYDKENTIGAINVDMVGEKDADGLIVRGNKGRYVYGGSNEYFKGVL